MSAPYKGPLDYIDVAARIVEFRTKHPEGSLQCIDLKFIDFANKSWVVYTAAAYRTPDDTRPGVGTAWEPVPGPTQFTRDSEVQNAETAAWGRAMVAALAVDTKKGIASQEEVRNRQVEKTEQAVKRDEAPKSDKPLTPSQQQIKDGLEMLAPDERAEFSLWWQQSGVTRGVQNLREEECIRVWGRLFSILNEGSTNDQEPLPPAPQGEIDPSTTVLAAFPSATPEVPMITNPQRGKIKALIGNDVEAKVSEILKREVTILGQVTKAEASKIIQQLEADKL